MFWGAIKHVVYDCRGCQMHFEFLFGAAAFTQCPSTLVPVMLSCGSICYFALFSIITTGVWCSHIGGGNTTDGHLGKTAIADGELPVSYERRENGYLPSYINGHSRRPEPEKVNPAAKEPVTLDSVTRKDQLKESAAFNSSQKPVVETQSAVCHITTEQLVATAEATVTRVVQGLVTSDDLKKHVNDLAGLMTDRLRELHEAISKLESRVSDYNEALKRGRFQQIETLVPHCDNPNAKTLSDSVQSPDNQKSFISDIYENEAQDEEAGVREPEILKYNSSIHLEPSHNGGAKKVFTYYWKIRRMQYKLTEWNPRRSFRSQSFYIYPGGYRLYLRIFPRQNEANFYIHVGITKGDFDAALKWPFPLKMRVAILDQTRDTPMFEDVTSRLWDPTQLCSEFNWQRPSTGDNYECVGLGLPHDVLYQRAYISSDSSVIKLTVYLDA